MSGFPKNKEGYYNFLFIAKTAKKYPLVIGTKYNIPFLLDSPGHGTYVKGEVYETDDNVLADLDELENHPNYYIRELRDFIPLNGGNTNPKIRAWVYVLKNFKRELLNEPYYESYSSAGNHGKKYVHTENRDKNYNIKADTFTDK